MEKLCDGCHIDINETGTKMRSAGHSNWGANHSQLRHFALGGWYRAFFPWRSSAKSVTLSLQKVTNDQTDMSVDVLKAVTLPILKNFGVEGFNSGDESRRLSKGGGSVELLIPIVNLSLSTLLRRD